MPVIIDVVMPARDEASTVAANVEAARACSHVRDVIVVDDGSTDGTGELAAGAGAKVVRREERNGSKAQAMAAGVAASGADAILFVDADCTGLAAAHLEAICEPFLAGRCDMSVGTFDYGRLRNVLIRRWPPLSGERIVHRELFEAVPASKLQGYTIEVRLNEVVGERRLRTRVTTMDGVRHRTKRAKHGVVEGSRRTWWMCRELVGVLRPFGDVRWRTYLFYLRGLTVER